MPMNLLGNWLIGCYLSNGMLNFAHTLTVYIYMTVSSWFIYMMGTFSALTLLVGSFDP